MERADIVYKGTRLLISAQELRITSPLDAAIVIEGRTIVGEGEGAVLLSVDGEDQLTMGPGPFLIEAVPFMPLRLPAIREHRVGRNNPCPCGSGRKYKKCHGAT